MPALDIFNSNSKQLPLDASYSASNIIQSQIIPQSSSIIQLANAAPQQQLPDTYALPLSNQPQLQQHFLQQHSVYQGIPVSVYNPTYLVTQSNQLLDQHKQRLFKPAPAFLGTYNQPTIDMSPAESQPLFDVQSVASPGQVYSASKAQNSANNNNINNAALDNFRLSSGQTTINSNIPNFQRITFNHNRKSTENRIVHGQQPSSQQPTLTENEVANLLNFGSLNNKNNQGFIASSYYETPSDSQSKPNKNNEIYDFKKHQQLNDQTISQANEEMKRIQELLSKAAGQTVIQTQQPAEATTVGSAHELHQQKVAEQFGQKSSLMIYVPDQDYSNVFTSNKCPL